MTPREVKNKKHKAAGRDAREALIKPKLRVGQSQEIEGGQGKGLAGVGPHT